MKRKDFFKTEGLFQNFSKTFSVSYDYDVIEHMKLQDRNKNFKMISRNKKQQKIQFCRFCGFLAKLASHHPIPVRKEKYDVVSKEAVVRSCSVRKVFLKVF